jgi:hypothetical protein
MKEIIDWIDRENARHDFVMKHRKKGFLKGLICCLIAKYISWKDPAPEALKKALNECD